jgi:predicted nuclease with TOPRIM domain
MNAVSWTYLWVQMNPAEATERLAELERENAALQNEVQQQARLNGRGSEREAALLAKVETLQRENAALREHHQQDEALIVQRTDEIRHLETENAALREMVDLAFRVPNLTDAELAELIRNCRAVRKEQP